MAENTLAMKATFLLALSKMYPRIFLLFSLILIIFCEMAFSFLFRKGQLVSNETVFAAASVGEETQNIYLVHSHFLLQKVS